VTAIGVPKQNERSFYFAGTRRPNPGHPAKWRGLGAVP
jgi:hypothetical protein